MKDASAFLRSGSDFLIATHLNPDGDAIGSSLALMLGLEAIGKKTSVLSKDGVPDYCRFLPGSERVRTSIGLEGQAPWELVLLDCNTPARAGLDGSGFGRTLVIDHHETFSDFGDVRWIEPAIPATGIMVFRLLKSLGVALTREISTNLYAAIALDTGTFRYPNTTAESFAIAAELAGAGADPGLVAHNLYDTWTRRKFMLLCMTLSTVEIEDSIAAAYVSEEMLTKTGTVLDDTENFVNFPMMMADVKISVLLKESGPGQWRVSLRSKGAIDVAAIASMHGGGGHRNAAGCTIEGGLDETKAKLREALAKLAV